MLRQALFDAKLLEQAANTHEQCIAFVEKGVIDNDAQTHMSEDDVVAHLIDMLKVERGDRVKLLQKELETIGVEDVAEETIQEKINKHDGHLGSFADKVHILKIKSDFIEHCPKVIKPPQEKQQKPKVEVLCSPIDLEPPNALKVARSIAEFHREVAIVNELVRRNNFPQKVVSPKKRRFRQDPFDDGIYALQQWAKRNRRCCSFARDGFYENDDTVQKLIDSLVADEILNPDSEEFDKVKKTDYDEELAYNINDYEPPCPEDYY
jgi:hypothetical protein